MANHKWDMSKVEPTLIRRPTYYGTCSKCGIKRYNVRWGYAYLDLRIPIGRNRFSFNRPDCCDKNIKEQGLETVKLGTY